MAGTSENSRSRGEPSEEAGCSEPPYDVTAPERRLGEVGAAGLVSATEGR